MNRIDLHDPSGTSVSSNRRKFMTLFAGASVVLAGAALAGCSDWDMRADPPKPKTMIIGRQSGPGGGPGRP